MQKFSAAERELLRHRFSCLRQVLSIIEHGEGKRQEKNGQWILQLSCHKSCGILSAKVLKKYHYSGF